MASLSTCKDKAISNTLSLPCLVLAHAEKGNYVVLKIGMFDTHPLYSTDFYGISLVNLD